MENIIISIFILLALFIPVFESKRRFGTLGLALAAGYLLNELWGYDIYQIAIGFGVPSNSIGHLIVSFFVIIAPTVVLLFHGHAYKTLIGRVIGASLFTVLAIAFMTNLLSEALEFHGIEAVVYNLILDNKNVIIGCGLVASVVDLFLTWPAKIPDKRH